MAGETVIRSLLFKCVALLCLGRYLCQKDCTGVDCPRLKYCIEEVLEQDACCSTCLQTGCKCEGYQYYDCVQAGFHNGKVPEGESYFVDFGSTECSCPQGGGRITCHFIPCPDVPANCIELSQPADGCAQCKRIGCTRRGQKFEAGHTFQMEPCQVCHCPNEGGPLMCYNIPNCDLLRIQKPVLPTPSEDEALEGRYSNPSIYDHEGNEEHLSQAHRIPPDENMPPAEEEPHRADEEDYDYLPTDMSSQDILPTEPSVAWVSSSENPSLLDRFDKTVKQELRERFGSHEVEASKEKATDSLQTVNEATPGLQETSTQDTVSETQTGQPVVDLLKVRNKEGSLVLLKVNTEPSIISEKDVLYVVDQEHKHSHTLSEANQEHKTMHRGEVKEMHSNVSKQDVLTEADLGRKTMQRGHVPELESKQYNKDVLSEAEPGHKTTQRGQVQELDSNRNNKHVLSEAEPGHKTTQRGQVPELDSNRNNKHVLSEAEPGHKTTQRGQVQELDSNRNNKHVLSEAEPGRKTTQRGQVQELDSNRNNKDLLSEAEPGHKTTQRGQVPELDSNRNNKDVLSEAEPGRKTTQRGQVPELDSNRNNKDLLSEADPGHKTTQRGQVQELDSNRNNKDVLSEADPGHKTTQRGQVPELDSNRNNKDLLSKAEPGRKTTQRGQVQELDSNRNNKDLLSEADPGHKTTQRGQVPELDSNRNNKDLLSEAEPGRKTTQRGQVPELDSNRNNKDLLSEADPGHKTTQRGQVPELDSNRNNKDVLSEAEPGRKTTQRGQVPELGSNRNNKDVLSEAEPGHKTTQRGQVPELDSNRNNKHVLSEADPGHKTTQRGQVPELDSNRNNKDLLSEAEPGHRTTQRGQVPELDSNRNNKDLLSEAEPGHKTTQRGQVQELDSNRNNKDVLSEAEPGRKTTQRGQVPEIDSNLNEKDVLSEADPRHKAIHRGHVQDMDSNLNKRHNVSSETESKHKNMHIIHEMDIIKKHHLSSEVGREHGSMHGANKAESSSSGLGSGRNERHSVNLSTRPETPEPSIPTTVTVKSKETKEAPYVHQAKEEDGQNALSSLSSHHADVSLNSLVEDCCKAGQKWAEGNNHCNAMDFIRQDRQSVCRTAQEQCCLAVLRESSCLAGMNAAKAGVPCDANGDECGNDSYKECCSCCTLGMHFRVAGQGCAAHEHLSYSCGNIFLSCCEEDESPGQPALRRRQRPEPTVLPDRVSDRIFPNEAFSILDREESANSVEDLEDVDECQLDGERLCHQRCINTWGSYECACFPGYTLHQDGFFCMPDNPTEDNRVGQEEGRARELPETDVPPTWTADLLNPCVGNGPCSHLCSMEGGQAHCSCFPGFSLMTDGYLCEDVDECSTDAAICPRGDVCVNTAGSYQCLPESCQEGFILNGNRECVDVNECVTNAHSCQANEKCVNSMGSFMCQRQMICPAGYQARDGVCEDVDECALGTHNCAVGFECQNMQGSFSCQTRQRCFTGFSQDTHGNCVDVDECSSLEEPCSSGFNCINTVGSYTCQRKIILCSQGYHTSADGARCIDVDECQTGAHRCGEGQICQNLPGTYRCNCQTGYQPDLIRGTCVDVNECWRYPGRLCAQTCENTPGSYRCTCTAGFSLSVDGKNCEDMNECNSNPCSQECANIYGSYQCYCRQGFYLKEDGHTCEDIDECSQSVGHLCAFKCVNIPGSYQCACPPTGYSMSPNGRTCRDIDECTIGAHNCSATETCYNVQGGFRCLSFSCPANYRRVSDIRCERISCPNFLECQNMPLRITYYQLNFQTNIIIPALIFRIGPSPAYSGDSIIIRITRGNEENYFSTRKLNAYTGAVYLQRQVREARDFLIDVEMKLLRQGSFTTFLARIYVFITAHSL
ncbi:fibulin-2 isoform X12 [Brienomyrus brachyistius]|uniref:fibulin-2 isoform X12 n=1 Tax=Brienomyrus brachyistius TaxID=42636 RepID=UPI0020B3FE58|nr:fibulin-2 isoform X12 [Brienomyrus brachyistius]